MQGSARKDVVFGAARGYTFTVLGPKWKSWFTGSSVISTFCPWLMGTFQRLALAQPSLV